MFVYTMYCPLRGGDLELETGGKRCGAVTVRLERRRFRTASETSSGRGLARKAGLWIVFLVFGIASTFTTAGDATRSRGCVQPGKRVGRKEAVEVYLFTPKGKIKNNNGSFELGVGTSDVFPGYQYLYWPYHTNLLENLKHPPPLPDAVVGEHHSGTKSLCLTLDNKDRVMQLHLRPPLIKLEDRAKSMHLSLWIKASKPGATCSFRFFGAGSSLGRYRNKGIDTKWTRIQGTVSVNGDGPGIRMEFGAGAAAPGKIWIDDIVWSFEDSDYATPSAEILIDPLSRDSLVFVGKPLKFSLKFRGDAGKKVRTELYLRDNIRDGLTTRLMSTQKTLAGKIASESFICPPLRRGIYMAAAVVRDAATGEVIAQDHQRFVVLTDLRELPPPADFVAGGMYIFKEPLGFSSRGVWSMRDMFRINAQLGCRVIRDLHTWEKLEPLYGKRDWAFYDFLMDSASKYKCGFMLDIPGVPFKVGRNGVERARKQKKWYVEKGRGHLMGGKYKPILEKTLKNEDFVALTKNDTFWMPEPSYMKDFCRDFLARYKNRGLMAVEYKNEVSAMVPPDYNVEHIMKPLYPVMKKAAPNIPLLVNNTGGSKLKYLQGLVDAGGLKWMDGFSFHPYDWNTLRFDSLENVLMYRHYLDKVSPGRHMQLGQTEEVFLYSLGIQRVLSDWAGGCCWSAGVPWRSFYGREHASYIGWHNTGPLTPSEFGLFANGMYTVLAGAKRIGCSETVPNTIVASFEKPASGGGKEYVVALCTAYKPGKAMLLTDVKLDGLRCKAYDATGERIPIPKGGLILTERPIYISSPDKRVLGLFANPKHKWVYNAHSRVFSEGNAFPVTQELIAGTPPYVVGCIPGDWEVGAGKAGAHGKLLRDESVKLKPCRTLSGSGNLHPKPIAGAEYLYLCSRIWTDGAAGNVVSISACGLRDAALVVNGKRVGKTVVFNKKGRLGVDWTDIPVGLIQGCNKIEVFSRVRAGVRPALRLKIQPSAGNRLAQLLPPPVADKALKDLTRAPGILLASHLLNGGDDDFYNPESKLYKLLEDPRLLKYIYYTTNKRNVAEIFIKFADSAPHVIKAYHFQPRFGRFPPAWKFEGSNDGKRWTTLDSVTGYHQRGKNWIYDKKLDNKTPYKQYRFLIPAAPFMVAWKGLRVYGE